MNDGVKPASKQFVQEKQFYSESEAARSLNISIADLHSILDRYVFNDGSARPQNLTFCDADLVLLGFWSHSPEIRKVVPMPVRANVKD